MTEVMYTPESKIKTNNIEIVFDAFGDSINPAILLIMGLGSQMIFWDDEFCRALASKGYRVIRYDNRDTGLSTKFDEADVPHPLKLLEAIQKGEKIEVPYKLIDMAKDAIGLLNALKIETAHIIGVSMGGMIAQTIAINFPMRVKTLISIMSSTGNPELPPPKPEALKILITTPPADRAQYLEYSVQTWKILQGSVYPIDENYIREKSARAFDRSYYPVGTARQFAAIVASGSRKDDLSKIKIPTLVIHGDIDPLVSVEAGKDTAKSIPGSKLEIIKGMGHNIPIELAPKIINLIFEHIQTE